VRPAPGDPSPSPTLMVTAESIARSSGTPLRTVQYRLKQWHKRGGPVERSPRACGGWEYRVRLEDYAARVGLDLDVVRERMAA